MKRRHFVKVGGMLAYAMSTSGFTLINTDGVTVGNCSTTTDMLGPFFRDNAPFRTDLRIDKNLEEVSVNVIGQVFASDCKTLVANALVDIWHCDEKKKYDMDGDDYKCRGRFYTDDNGNYEFQTFIPPPYGGRPKHIHYLVHAIDGHQDLVTQLYFKGDKRIKPNNWVKYKWDERRILEVYENEKQNLEVKLDLYLTAKDAD